jgi:outer membrane lipoprotein-sorting protein
MILSRPLTRYPWARWAVPVTVAAVAVGGTALFTQVTADAAAVLPARSAAQLLVDLQGAKQIVGSGTVVQKAELGLPQLPTMGGSGSSDLTSLIAGSHTLRLWSGGPDQARIALMGTLGESDVIRNGRDVWTWSSNSNSATHLRLPADPAGAAKLPAVTPDRAALTPQQLADQALASITPTTQVTTDGTARVAGRSAYELVLAPKDTASLVGQIRIAIDASRHVPLRVQVFARNATSAAVEVGFTQISFARPSAAQFRFTPPPGVKITDRATSTPDPADAQSAEKAAQPSVTGKGWTSVLQAQLPADATSMLQGGGRRSADGTTAQLERMLSLLPTVSGSWGSGHLLHSSLFTVLLTDSGRVLAGAVPAARLYELAAQPLPAATS